VNHGFSRFSARLAFPACVIILTPAYAQDAKIAKINLNESNQQNQLNQLNYRPSQWQIRAWKVIFYPHPALPINARSLFKLTFVLPCNIV
jgi:hypothetical protein